MSKRRIVLGCLLSLFLASLSLGQQNKIRSADVNDQKDGFPRFESADCPFEKGEWSRDFKVECGWLLVPEVRDNPQSRTVRLAVAILKTTQPSGAPPFVMLHGGPRGIGGLRQFLPRVARWTLARERDIVVYDRRAVGYSEPKLCPEYEPTVIKIRKQYSGDEQLKRRHAAMRACLESMRNQGSDPAAYSTETNVADLIDLRRALGYASWNLFGGSYGTLLAQQTMRRDPMGIRSVVLQRPVVPGPPGLAEQALSVQNSLERVFAACANQPQCKKAFPKFESDFYSVYDELRRKPLTIRTDSGETNAKEVLDSERFVRDIAGHLSDPAQIRSIPLLVNELRRGDRVRAAKVFVENDAEADNPILHLVFCFDFYGASYRKVAASIGTRVHRPFRALVDSLDDCRLWQQRFADPSEHVPVKSNIPTLILTGKFDPSAPPEYGARIASTLKRAYVYELPGESHGGRRPFGCEEEIVYNFLKDPNRAPDSSCIATMPHIVFETRWIEVRGQR
jgi:pimeloyl-ACP methyl ester carboxylesterase